LLVTMSPSLKPHHIIPPCPLGVIVPFHVFLYCYQSLLVLILIALILLPLPQNFIGIPS